MPLVLELADEFHLTTADALEICVAAGVAHADASTELTRAEAERWRALARARQDWQTRNQRQPAGVGASTFGPLPEAPWEPRADGSPHPTVPTAPAMNPTSPPLHDSAWGTAGDTGGGPVLTPYAPAALALAVVSLIFPFIPAFGAFALAWYAKDRIERDPAHVGGERLATAAQVVAGIGIVLWGSLLAFSVYRDVRDDAAARDDGQVEVGVLGWDEIAPGNCVRIPRADLAVSEWTALDCTQPHEAEVFATELVRPTTNPDERYPGRESLLPGATRVCQERFADYVGVPYDASALRIGVFYPTAGNWSTAGDRTIGCIVFQEDYALIPGTLEQSRR